MSIIISITIVIISSVILYIIYNNKKKYLKEQYKDDIYNQMLSETEEKFKAIKASYAAREAEALENFENTQNRIRKERELLEQGLTDRKTAIEETLEQINARKEEAEAYYNSLLEEGKEQVEIKVKSHENLLMSQAAARIKEETDKEKEKVKNELTVFIELCKSEENRKRLELGELSAILEDFKKKQEVINQEILRKRQVEEQQDFYRVVLEENAVSDMQILLNIREKLIFRENLDKLIYDVYISKAVLEMIKRVLGGRAPSGIYKITRLKTGEIYIGKSTDIKKRWTEHCKTAYGVGSIAHSILHTTIRRDGIENFTFELLEEVPKDKLTEREKYWITFYGSKEYGLNERVG